MDDGESYDYQEGTFIHRKFSFAQNTLTSSAIETETQSNNGKKRRNYIKTMDRVRVEKIIIVIAPKEWATKKEVNVIEDGEGRSVEMTFTKGDGKSASWAVVRDLGVGVGRGLEC